MCGIFGHVSHHNSSLDKCLKGLKFLEYRGYDSAGIAGNAAGTLFCYKEKGKISELEKKLQKKLHVSQSSIGHTRWATHGKASELNAHPQLDQKKEIAVVHNGILENHFSLRTMLSSHGMKFESETDTEVIAQLIAFFYKGNFFQAVKEATALMKGFWGLAILHKNHPDQIIATRFENPIVVGISKKNQEAFVSSDPYAFMEKDLDLYFLKNHEIALIFKDKIEIFDHLSQLVKLDPEIFEIPSIEVNKGDFSHFMLKEIYEHPKAIQNALQNRFNIENGKVEFENFAISKEEFNTIREILLLGCGTSWHAGSIAAQQIEELCELPTRSEIASEYRYKKVQVNSHTLVIAISQSGETFDTLGAIRKVKQEGAKVLAICNVHGSTLTREAHHTILLNVGAERSVCSTKAFTGQLSVLSLLVIHLGRLGILSKKQGIEFLKALSSLPNIVETVLEQGDRISKLAKKYSSHSNFFFFGRQYMLPTSLEGALKLKEITYLNATAYPAGELKHGPIALIDSSSVVIGLCGNMTTYEKMLSNLTEVKSRGAKILVLAPLNAPEIDQIADDILWLPHIRDELAPFPYTVALQLFAFHMALHLDRDIDHPRNLAKSVTVE